VHHHLPGGLPGPHLRDELFGAGRRVRGLAQGQPVAERRRTCHGRLTSLVEGDASNPCGADGVCAGGAVTAGRWLVGPVALVVLLALLAATAGLSGLGWTVGLACGGALTVVEARGLSRFAHARGPADRVTLARAVLACGVAAVVADSFATGTTAVAALVALVVPALLLDAADGWVARRTRTASPFGGWFDGEVDAFLILVLSVDVARSAGAWVLALGGARYAFGLAGRVLPWLRAPLPPRYWRKVVTATVGIMLAAAAADVGPAVAREVGLIVALVLLAESFGRDVIWLWQRRATRREPAPASGRTQRGHAA
jgi:phosphatidylglycerophosphate synthase